MRQRLQLCLDLGFTRSRYPVGRLTGLGIRPHLGYSSGTMYMPPHFDSKDRALAVDLMRDHPLATVISTDDAGFPFLSHLPLHLEQRGDALVLLGHCARPNAHWRYLQLRPKALVSFMGPQAYMSPRVYPELTRVPTWNYLAVQCTVEARLIDEPLHKDRLLKKLIGDHDPAYIPQWIARQTSTDLPPWTQPVTRRPPT